MKKIVINTCHGGFGLSKEAYKFLGKKWDGYGYADDIKRDDPKLIECIEKLGKKASKSSSCLTVVEIPDEVEWEIEEHAGLEWISEKHGRWYG